MKPKIDKLLARMIGKKERRHNFQYQEWEKGIITRDWAILKGQ